MDPQENFNFSFPVDLNPLTQPGECLEWISKYLKPIGIGGAGKRAHQFTINGLTYPFIRYYNFAAVPDIPDKTNRRYDMFSSLHIPQQGDLLFFFQSDPQNPNGDINSRRGMRGIYVVDSSPYRATGAVEDSISGLGYKILDRCPNPDCLTFESTLSSTCQNCSQNYPDSKIVIDRKTKKLLVLSSQINIKPLWAFERSVSDERVYGDLSDPGMIWIGRHDNAMGRGKGSSIRHLLPEEAVKLTRLLINEPEQTIGAPTDEIRTVGDKLTSDNSLSIDSLECNRKGEIKKEDKLYYAVTRQIFSRNSNFKRVLEPHLPNDLSWDNLEYASSTFPWGYTAGAADYVLIFRNNLGRRFVVIVECKKGNSHDEVVLQTLLYVERTLQVAFAFADESVFPPPQYPVEILPVIITKGVINLNRIAYRKLAIPVPWKLSKSYPDSRNVEAEVRSPLFVTYQTRPKSMDGTDKFYEDVNNIDFKLLQDRHYKHIEWVPPIGAVGTSVELNWIKNNSWRDARNAAGI